MMIFKQVDEIISGAKTQTRRMIKADEKFDVWGFHQTVYTESHDHLPLPHQMEPRRRIKWQARRDYAVVSKRGTRGVWWNPASGDWYVPESAEDTRVGYEPLRVRVTAIRQERLHEISDEDAKAEGVLNKQNEIVSAREWYAALWDSINKRAGTRWVDNPLVWVITFEVVLPDGWCPGCREFVAGEYDDFAARHHGICYECWQDMRVELGE